MSEGIRGGRPSMRGSSRLRTRGGQAPAPTGGTQLYHNLPKAQPAAGKKKVLFVCIGNSCRSQMAEGFAKKYGGDILTIQSAGLSPAAIVQDETHRTMATRGITLQGQYPKGIELLTREQFDVIINMSGYPLPKMNGRVVDWPVKDPIGLSEDVYEAVANQIEQRVMRLVLDLRSV